MKALSLALFAIYLHGTMSTINERSDNRNIGKGTLGEKDARKEMICWMGTNLLSGLLLSKYFCVNHHCLSFYAQTNIPDAGLPAGHTGTLRELGRITLAENLCLRAEHL
jgi:hypothetical protein